MRGDEFVRYRILFKDKVDKSVLREVKERHNGDVEGISELYDLLIENGTCDSDTVSRIYYVAYTLSLKGIEMIIVKLD